MHRRTVAFIARRESGALAAIFSASAVVDFGELGIGHDVVNDIHVTAVLGVEQVGGVENPGGVGGAANLDQLAGEVVRHHQADASERHAELRVVGRDSKITMQREFESSRERGALHSRDGRHREALQPAENGLERSRVVNAAGLVHFFQIDSRAKARAFAAQEQRPDFAIVFELAKRLVERFDQRLIESIALFRDGSGSEPRNSVAV